MIVTDKEQYTIADLRTDVLRILDLSASIIFWLQSEMVCDYQMDIIQYFECSGKKEIHFDVTKSKVSTLIDRFNSPKHISDAIKYNKPAINNKTAREMYRECLQIFRETDGAFKAMKDKMYTKIVEPVYKRLHLKPKSKEYIFEVVNKRENTTKTIKLQSKMVCIGQDYENDVYLSQDVEVDLLQGFMFVTGDKMIF